MTKRATINDWVKFAFWLLTSSGYAVAPPGKPETIGQLNKRLGIGHNRIYLALKRPHCPFVDIERTKTGRIIVIRSNKIFEEFVMRNHRRDRKQR